MPLQRFTADQAFGGLRRNRAAVWPDGRKDGRRLDGIATVAIQPGFAFGRDTSILTIGSCFAREIEKHLSDLNFDLPMTSVSVPREERISEVANDILNKYSVHSIENEIRWAFEPSDIPIEKRLLETEDGLWHDPQLAPNLIPASLDRVVARREQVTHAMRQLSRCGLVIITLGLAESWHDLETGLYLNGAPPAASLKRYPGRFVVDVLSYSEILESLERIQTLIQRYGQADSKMLITTSPVPFKATMSGQDALVANCYSKSVQRAVCREFSAGHPGVDYFPSYEVVTLTERALAFEIDNIHVKPAVVRTIMHSVLRSYCPEIPSVGVAESQLSLGKDADVVALKALKLFKKKQYLEAAEAYEHVLKLRSKTIDDVERGELMTTIGVAYLRARETSKGVEVLRAALSHIPLDARLNYKVGLGLARLGKTVAATRFMENALRLDASVPDHHWRLGVEYQKQGKVERAEALYRDALKTRPDFEPALVSLRTLTVDRDSVDAA